jgi:hypothetical protein
MFSISSLFASDISSLIMFLSEIKTEKFGKQRLWVVTAIFNNCFNCLLL